MKWIKASDRLPEAQKTIICKVDGHDSIAEGHKAVLNGYWSEMFKLFYIYDRTDVYPYDAEHVTWLDETPDELTAADYEEVLADHKRLVRELDVIMNGEYAAKQASLVDLVAQARGWKEEAKQLIDPIIEYGQNHPDLKLGRSCSEFVLNRAKGADVLVKALEEIKKSKSQYDAFQIAHTALEQYKKETT